MKENKQEALYFYQRSEISKEVFGCNKHNFFSVSSLLLIMEKFAITTRKSDSNNHCFFKGKVCKAPSCNSKKSERCLFPESAEFPEILAYCPFSFCFFFSPRSGPTTTQLGKPRVSRQTTGTCFDAIITPSISPQLPGRLPFPLYFFKSSSPVLSRAPFPYQLVFRPDISPSSLIFSSQNSVVYATR